MKVLLPYVCMNHFVCFSINKHTSRLYVLDPLSETMDSETKLIEKHILELKLLRISFYLNDALNLAQPDWDSDIFSWPRKSPPGLPKSSNM